MQPHFQIYNCVLLVHKDTIQFTAESRSVSVFMMHDLLNKWSRYSSLEGYVWSVSCVFIQNMLLACKSLIFLNKATLLRQNIDDAWKMSRFNCRTYRVACSIWTCFVTSTCKTLHNLKDTAKSNFHNSTPMTPAPALLNLYIILCIFQFEFNFRFIDLDLNSDVSLDFNFDWDLDFWI